MYHTVVLTAGISMFVGRNNVFAIHREDLPKIPVSLQDRLSTQEIQGQIDDWIDKLKPFFEQIKENHSRVSAEYSMVHTLKNQGKLGDRPLIIMFVTNTVGGYAGEKIHRELFEKQFQADVKVFYVDIHVDHPEDLNREIGEYMKKLAEALEAGEPNTTCFAPIGGYKVMTSFGYIVGSFLGYPTAYLHEDHQILHEIPPVPIQIDLEQIEHYTSLLRQCQADYVEIDNLGYDEKQFIKQFQSLFYVEDGWACLNPFGRFLFERTKYKHIFETKYLVSDQVRSFMKTSNPQSLFIKQQMRELVKKLQSGEARQNEIRHELDFATLERDKIQFHLYKGASNGRHVFRLAYRYDDKDDVLYANYVWLDHNRYEREASVGKGLYHPVSEFTDIAEREVMSKER
ncbi:CRISPR-associated protein [Caldalkalibacillus thermarum]|uniref:CRISPR-associated protein n=1 Tax=Caldalkalibacillus thermarum TaxID=296745 RepID=UPI00166A9A30|nr:CRISPR-associated protein [Caldalkalibacillus thermarum]